MEAILAVLAQALQVPTWGEWIGQPQSKVAVAAVIVSLVAACAGWLSAISSARSAGTAKKNLHVAREALSINSDTAEAANKTLKPDFTNAIYLPRSYANTYVFDVAVTNPATRPNTLVSAKLTLILVDGSEVHFDPKSLPSEMKTKTPLILPLELGGSAHRAGSLAYEVPSEFLKGRAIKRFRINFADANERRTPIDTISMARHAQ